MASAWEEGRSPRFIAEASSNHARDLSRALAFVDAAADARLRRGEVPALQDRPHVRARNSRPERQASRTRANGNCRWRIWRRSPNIAGVAPSQFSCTPFYLEAVEELRPYVDFYKVASYELLVTPLLEACAQTGKPIVLSTGMATMEEIRKAVIAAEIGGCRAM